MNIKHYNVCALEWKNWSRHVLYTSLNENDIIRDRVWIIDIYLPDHQITQME